MNGKQETQIQTAIRLPESVLKRVDKLAEHMSQPGARTARAAALRHALLRGLSELEAERKKR